MDLNTLSTGNPTADKVIHILAVVVTIASFLANVVPPDTKVGRVLHWVALNFKVGKKEESK